MHAYRIGLIRVHTTICASVTRSICCSTWPANRVVHIDPKGQLGFGQSQVLCCFFSLEVWKDAISKTTGLGLYAEPTQSHIWVSQRNNQKTFCLSVFVLFKSIFPPYGTHWLTTPNHLSQVQCFDPETDSWLLRANIPIAKRCITAVSLNNLIYVCGGLTKSIFCYDPTQDYWMHVVHTFNKQVMGRNHVYRIDLSSLLILKYDIWTGLRD